MSYVTIYELDNNCIWPAKLKREELEELGLEDNFDPISSWEVSNNLFIYGFLEQMTTLKDSEIKGQFVRLPIEIFDDFNHIMYVLTHSLEKTTGYPFLSNQPDEFTYDLEHGELKGLADKIKRFLRVEIGESERGKTTMVPIAKVLGDNFSRSFKFFRLNGEVDTKLISQLHEAYVISDYIVNNKQKYYIYGGE